MGWIRHTEPAPEHTCEPPMRERRWQIPKSWQSADATEAYHSEEVPDGSPGDLWQCDDCRRVWTIRDQHRTPGIVTCWVKWEPAGWWKQHRYRDRATT